MSKSKQIGTAAETAVRKALLSRGWSELQAHRQILKGSQDEGDVWLRHPELGLIVFEVKGGAAAKKASRNQRAAWMVEAMTEKINAGADFGFLVTQKAGVGAPRAHMWDAYIFAGDFLHLTAGGRWDSPAPEPILHIEFSELIDLFALRA